MDKHTLIASARFGLEMVVKNELRSLGFDEVRATDGKVTFSATLEEVARANLWLRTADRVFLQLGTFDAQTFDELFEGAAALPWETFVARDGAVTVNVSTQKSALQSERSCQSIIMKAIVERLKRAYGISNLEESGPAYTVQVTILRDNVVLALDTSGSGLHKRGYRERAGEAPLKETLAAGLVLLSRWQDDEFLIDPLCGSGTILIEAAMIACNMAPGSRRHFAAEVWPAMEKTWWDEARQEAEDAVMRGKEVAIFGYDIDPSAVALGMENAREAGVAAHVALEQKDIHDLWIDREYGSVITNPPYGRRMADYSDLNRIYVTLNKMFRKKRGWSVYVLTADSMFPKYFKRARPDRVRKMYNGRIRVNYYQYYGKSTDERRPGQ